MGEQTYLPGWDESRVREVLTHYEAQDEDEQFAEIETAREAEDVRGREAGCGGKGRAIETHEDSLIARHSRVRPEARHRFTLSAAVLLVAAIGLGLALVRPALKTLADRPMIFQSRVETYVFYGLVYATPIAFSRSLATLAWSLKRPRPTLRLLSRWPGFVANVAGIVGVLVMLLPYLGQTIQDPSRFPQIYMHVLSTGLPGDVGFFVVGALVPSMLRGDCCPRPTWEDRLGWLIGMTWILMASLTFSRLFLYLLG